MSTRAPDRQVRGPDDGCRLVSLQLLRDADHDRVLLDRMMRDAQVSLWIATANVRDVHIEAPIGSRARARGRYQSIVELFTQLVRRGVEIKLLHGALPSRPFRKRLAAQPIEGDFEMRHCPRLHLKMVAVDGLR